MGECIGQAKESLVEKLMQVEGPQRELQRQLQELVTAGGQKREKLFYLTLWPSDWTSQWIGLVNFLSMAQLKKHKPIVWGQARNPLQRWQTGLHSSRICKAHPAAALKCPAPIVPKFFLFFSQPFKSPWCEVQVAKLAEGQPETGRRLWTDQREGHLLRMEDSSMSSALAILISVSQS